jgi:hypothetical protein
MNAVCRSKTCSSGDCPLELNERKRYPWEVSIAEKIFEKAQALPEQAQDELLRVAESLAAKNGTSLPSAKPQFGSAKGLVKIGPEFDEPLEDFKPYME